MYIYSVSFIYIDTFFKYYAHPNMFEYLGILVYYGPSVPIRYTICINKQNTVIYLSEIPKYFENWNFSKKYYDYRYISIY